jgi:hypothetical protein
MDNLSEPATVFQKLIEKNHKELGLTIGTQCSCAPLVEKFMHESSTSQENNSPSYAVSI